MGIRIRTPHPDPGFGNNLKLKLKSLGISRKNFAIKINCHIESIHKWTRDETYPADQFRSKIEELTGLTLLPCLIIDGTKRCSNCGQYKQFDQFSERLQGSKLTPTCKICEKENRIKIEQKENIKQKRAEYRKSEQRKIASNKYRNKESSKLKQKEKYKNNKEEIDKKNMDRYYINKNEIAINRKIKYQNEQQEIKSFIDNIENNPNLLDINKNKIKYDNIMLKIKKKKVKAQESFQRNKSKINEKRRLKRQQDFEYKIRGVISQQLMTAIKAQHPKSKNSKNGESLWAHLSYTPAQFWEYIISLCTGDKEWMNKENHGPAKSGQKRWHIDHIRPISSFKLLNEDNSVNWVEVKKCWDLSNLQPLEAIENIIKSNKYDPELKIVGLVSS